MRIADRRMAGAAQRAVSGLTLAISREARRTNAPENATR
jgi:hypothetical protein